MVDRGWDPVAHASGSTVHVSVVDDNGMACATTASAGYGSGATIPGTGILMNNCLGEPELNRRGVHALRPGTRLGSNMAPSVGRHADGSVLAIGSPGADRITTALLQVLGGHALGGLDLQAAVDAPRLHVRHLDDAASCGSTTKPTWSSRTWACRRTSIRPARCSSAGSRPRWSGRAVSCRRPPTRGGPRRSRSAHDASPGFDDVTEQALRERATSTGPWPPRGAARLGRRDGLRPLPRGHPRRQRGRARRPVRLPVAPGGAPAADVDRRLSRRSATAGTLDPDLVIATGDVMAGVMLAIDTLCADAPVVVPTPAYPPFLEASRASAASSSRCRSTRMPTGRRSTSTGSMRPWRRGRGPCCCATRTTRGAGPGPRTS